ncbi:serine/threonine-protein kinase [Aquimonas voraii]|uniref:Serine/threonine protein kinase n=1 Tax=Aquimonas voraii TaxID=265719 RepID=A0A1G6VLW5_9GAMM|nr:serine/threonine-protein kinase [Aquimonas voraii]SDD54630.1 serine/threonine protein kinase [Aquimonas voraii]
MSGDPSDPDWAPLAALFEQLADLPAAEQAQALSALRDDPAAAHLLPRLRSLLDAHARTGDCLTQGAAAQAVGAVDAVASARSGDRLGPWRLLQPLGEGGMGEVWLAERAVEGLGQRAALKRIRSGLGPELGARFLRERRILARLSHPHIAAFIDAGVEPGGTPWMAMEYVEGEGLQEHCARRRLDPRARVDLILQVLDALDHAHRQLVVHRDLKPGNVMVDTEGRVKLLDFGIARLLDDSELDPALTRTRAPAPLTPRYAAPEQLAGEPAGIAADLYSTGLLLFELLSGRSPFGETAGSMAARESPESLWRAFGRAENAAGYGLSEGALRRQLRGDLQQILGRALEPQPGARYPSAAAFAEDLRAWREQRPLRSRPTPWPQRLAKWMRRQPLASASLGVAVLAIAAGIGSSLWQAQRAAERAAQAEAARRFLGEVFSAADPLLQDAEPPSLAEVLARGAERLRAEASLEPRARLLLLQDLARASLGLDQLDQAASLLSEAEALSARLALDANEQRALALDQAALALARDAIDAGLARLAGLPLPSPAQPPDALALRELGLRSQLLLARSKSQEAIDLLAPYLHSTAWQTPAARAELLALVASAQMQAGRPREAVAAIELALAQLDPQAPLGLRLQLYETEVEALRGLLETPRAMARQREVIALVEARLGPAHARSQWARMMLCGLLIGEGALGAADAEYRALWQALGPLDDRDSLRAEALFGWGMVSFRRGEFALARQRFGEARALFERAFGADSHKTRNALEAEAMARVEVGEVDAGLETLRALVAQSRALDDHTRLSAQLNSLAMGLLAAQRANEALPLIDESLALAAELGQLTTWTRVIQARALRLAGQPERALTVAEVVAAEYRESISPNGGPRRAEAERELALALFDLPDADREQALALLRSVLEQRRASLGEGSPLTRASVDELAAAAKRNP